MGDTASLHPQPPATPINPDRLGVIADEEQVVRRGVALSPHLFPAHLGVGLVDDELVLGNGLYPWRRGSGCVSRGSAVGRFHPTLRSTPAASGQDAAGAGETDQLQEPSPP